MKSVYILSALIAALTLGGVATQVSTSAQSKENKGILTSEHIEVIKQNCPSAQSVMRQLHKSDKLLRVNQVQLYESIDDKLMTPFNARAALNQYDTAKLVTVTNEFRTHINEFRDIYRDYDKELSDTISSDCQAKPVKFYESLDDARESRQELHDKSKQLIKDVSTYRDAFEELVKQREGDA